MSRHSGRASYFSGGRVVGVGAVCDFKAGPPGWGQSLHFSIKEIVVLEDGRHVIVDERGINSSTGRALMKLEDGQRVVLENVTLLGGGKAPDYFRQDVLNAVLPADDDEALKDAHPWSYLAEQARRLGIQVTADELKALDYEMMLTERVARWLGG